MSRTVDRSIAARTGLLLAALLAAVCLACGIQPTTGIGLQVAGGEPARGRTAMQAYACGSCHVIPGVPNANGNVGPPLSGIANRQIIGGYLPNTSDNLVRWIRSPQSVAPGNAMPDMGVTDQEALDIAAYLATLR